MVKKRVNLDNEDLWNIVTKTIIPKTSDKILEIGKFSSVQYNSSDDVINSYGMKISGSVTAFGNNAGAIFTNLKDLPVLWTERN